MLHDGWPQRSATAPQSGELSPSSPSATALTSPNLSRVSPTRPHCVACERAATTSQSIPSGTTRSDATDPPPPPVRLTPPTTSVLMRAVITGGGRPHGVKVKEYRKIKRPFPPTASAHPMPLCSRWCPRLASARTPRAAHPGEHPTRACPRRPAPPGATPRRRASTWLPYTINCDTQ